MLIGGRRPPLTQFCVILQTHRKHPLLSGGNNDHMLELPGILFPLCTLYILMDLLMSVVHLMMHLMPV